MKCTLSVLPCITACIAYLFLSNDIFALYNGFILPSWTKIHHHNKHIRLYAQIHYQKMLLPSSFIQRIYWQTSSAACFIQERIKEVLLYHYVSLPSAVLLMASDGTGVRWPHVYTSKWLIISTQCKYCETICPTGRENIILLLKCLILKCMDLMLACVNVLAVEQQEN